MEVTLFEEIRPNYDQSDFHSFSCMVSLLDN